MCPEPPSPPPPPHRACGGFYSTVHSELCLGVIKVPSTLHLQYDNENRFTTYAQPNQEMVCVCISLCMCGVLCMVKC